MTILFSQSKKRRPFVFLPWRNRMPSDDVATRVVYHMSLARIISDLPSAEREGASRGASGSFEEFRGAPSGFE